MFDCNIFAFLSVYKRFRFLSRISRLMNRYVILIFIMLYNTKIDTFRIHFGEFDTSNESDKMNSKDTDGSVFKLMNQMPDKLCPLLS